MDPFVLYILAGGAVGFIVGLTGVGGGSLMTPLLLLFGFPPQVAIGTDLLYASITKGGGALLHAKEQRVHWDILIALSAGSLPAALLTVLFLSAYGVNFAAYESIFTVSLGVMLIVTALMLLFRKRLFAQANAENRKPWLIYLQEKSRLLTFAAGIFLGVAVTLTSVGAGIIGTAVLLVLYPRLTSSNVVGTELAHAVPLALIAGMGHFWLGHIDFDLLYALLIGSLPATYLGVTAGKHMPEPILRSCLIIILVFAGVKCTFF